MKVKLLTNGKDKVVCCESRHAKTFFFPVEVYSIASIEHRYEYENGFQLKTLEKKYRVLEDESSKDHPEYFEAYELAKFAWDSQMFDETLTFEPPKGNLNPLAMRMARADALGKLREMQQHSWERR